MTLPPPMALINGGLIAYDAVSDELADWDHWELLGWGYRWSVGGIFRPSSNMMYFWRMRA